MPIILPNAEPSAQAELPKIGGDPSFYLLIGYGDTSDTNLGGMSNAVREDGGWIKHVATTASRWMKWAGSEGHTFGVIVERPFGHWRPGDYDEHGNHRDQLELDSFDWASASGQPWIYAKFAEAWSPVCAKHRVWAYCGNVAGHPELASLPPAALATMIRRNCKPFEDAGFHGVIIDTGAYAITMPHINTAKILIRPKSIEFFTLATIDRMDFATRTAVEPIPPNHPVYADLITRDCFVSERVLAQCHLRGKSTDRTLDDGYSSDTDYVKGRIHRWVLPNDLPGEGTPVERVVKRCREVVAAGHVPCVPAYLLAGQCRPSDLMGEPK